MCVRCIWNMNLMFKVDTSLRCLIMHMSVFQNLKSTRADPRWPGHGIFQLYSEPEHLVLSSRLGRWQIPHNNIQLIVVSFVCFFFFYYSKLQKPILMVFFCFVTQADLKLTIPLSQFLQCRHSSYVPPCYHSDKGFQWHFHWYMF